MTAVHDQDFTKKTSGHDAQSQNNNGNIGRDAGEKQGSDSLDSISEDINTENPVNEEGVAENEESHWIGNQPQISADKLDSLKDEIDTEKNLRNEGQPDNKGRNHVTNAGGTSQEDLEQGKTGLTEEENRS